MRGRVKLAVYSALALTILGGWKHWSVAIIIGALRLVLELERLWREGNHEGSLHRRAISR